MCVAPPHTRVHYFLFYICVVFILDVCALIYAFMHSRCATEIVMGSNEILHVCVRLYDRVSMRQKYGHDGPCFIVHFFTRECVCSHI